MPSANLRNRKGNKKKEESDADSGEAMKNPRADSPIQPQQEPEPEPEFIGAAGGGKDGGKDKGKGKDKDKGKGKSKGKGKGKDKGKGKGKDKSESESETNPLRLDEGGGEFGSEAGGARAVLPCLPFWKEGGDDAGEESNCCVEFTITLVVVFLIVGLLGMPWPPSRN